jgi:BirA family biotin operon repressor/biotin-[acetyl-CoA-carboxylase] ligase
VIDIEVLERHLTTKWVGRDRLLFEQTESTNDLAKYPPRELIHGSLLLADYQTKGRGLSDKSWFGDAHKNLYFSIYTKPFTSEGLFLLSLISALSVIESIRSYHLVHPLINRLRIKWPNDVYIGEYKIAGILTENIFSGSYLKGSIIGTGWNINQDYFPLSLRDSASSLRLLFPEDWIREELLARYLNYFEHYYSVWESQPHELVVHLNSHLLGYNKPVRVVMNGQEVPELFTCLGLDTKGHLRVLNKEKEVDTFTYEQIRIHPA